MQEQGKSASIQKTQQLIKSLTLHFIHHKIINTSILQQLCHEQKIHASTNLQQTTKKIVAIDNAFQLLKQNVKQRLEKQSKQSSFQSQLVKNLYNMVNIFIFNVSAINQNYIKQVQKQLTQSTASKSMQNQLNQTIYKDKMALQILKQHLLFYFESFTQNSTFLHDLINQIETNPQAKVSQSKLGLLQSLDYLCVKYSVQNDVAKKIVRILEKNQQTISENMSKIHHTEAIKQTNKLLFSQRKQQQLFKMLQTNSSINFKNVMSIINSNYLNQNPSRKIFDSAEICGKKVIQNIMVRIIKRIDKNDLFSQKSQQYTPFRIFLYHLLNKHFPVYLQFNNIMKQLMKDKNFLNSQKGQQNLKSIQKFFRIFISIQCPTFHQILAFIYNQLSIKYSPSSSLQLIKKLLLNRFLLNPSFFVLYNDPNQNQIKKYVEVANIVRILFYKNKVQQLVQKVKNPYLSQISSEICYSLDYCLKKQSDPGSIVQNKSFLYINDKILKSQMQIFYHEFLQQKDSHKQSPNVKNIVSDYSLSFSLVKNDQASRNQLTSHPLLQNLSEVKFPMNTNRSNANVKDNQSMRAIYDQLKCMKSQNQIPPRSPQKVLRINNKVQNKDTKNQFQRSQNQNLSQLSRKNDQADNQTRLYTKNAPTDRQILQELIQYRKQYGERQRALKLKYEQKRQRRIKRISMLDAFSMRFNQQKNQIQSQNNLLYIHMTTMA